MIRKLVAAAAVAATLAAPATAQAAPLPGVPSNSTKPVVQQKPKTVYFGMTTHVVLERVKWTRVTPTFANATATLDINTCEPYCAIGRHKTQKVKLVFRVVTKAKQPYFNCVRVDIPNGPVSSLVETDQMNLPLSPAAYREKIDCGPFNVQRW